MPKEDYRSLSGQEKAAIFMLSVGEDHISSVFKLMDDDEIRELSQAMANLGTVSSSLVERIFVEFAEQVSSTGSLVGTYESTERLLAKIFSARTVSKASWTKSAAPPAAPCGTSSATSTNWFSPTT